MDVLMVSPEVVPFSKVGAIADVVGALPKALHALGHRVTVLSLRYGSIDPAAHAFARRLTKLPVTIGSETVAAEIYEARLPSGINVTLLNVPGLTDRPRIYGEPDDARRFVFLCHGAIAWSRSQPKLPDVIHAHDWTTGLLMPWVHREAATDPRWRAVRTVFSVHDIGAQGLVPGPVLRELGVPTEWYTPAGMEFYGEGSLLKAGLVFAQKITCGSASYAKDLATPEGGQRMDGVVRARVRDVVGIVNGIDYAIWNPATDPHLVARYDAEDTSAKLRCKADLQSRCELAVRPDVPLLGWVARLEERKGIDLLIAAAPRLIRHELQLAILGDGEARFAEPLLDLAKRFPDRVFFKSAFDDELAHRIYAGSDFFLAPSRSEADGLGHLYAMRYGAVPIARNTGSLRDTLVDCDAGSTSGTGFVFDLATADELAGAVGRALAMFRETEALSRLRRRTMRRDFSWDRSARQMQSLYASVIPDERKDTAVAGAPA